MRSSVTQEPGLEPDFQAEDWILVQRREVGGVLKVESMGAMYSWMGPTWVAGHVSWCCVSSVVMLQPTTSRHLYRRRVKIEFEKKTNPFKHNFTPRLHRHKCPIALRTLMAYNIHVLKLIRAHESIVQIIRLPPDRRWNGRLVLERRVPALVGHAVGDDLLDVAVGADEGGEKGEGEG